MYISSCLSLSLTISAILSAELYLSKYIRLHNFLSFWLSLMTIDKHYCHHNGSYLSPFKSISLLYIYFYLSPFVCVFLFSYLYSFSLDTRDSTPPRRLTGHREHWLYPPPPKKSVLDIAETASQSKASVLLIWEVWSTPLLPLLPGQLKPRMIEPVKVSCSGQNMFNIIYIW